jgi:hypothetical protein
MLHEIRRRVPTDSKTLGFLSRDRRAISITLTDRAAASASGIGIERFHMGHEKEVRSAGNSARGARIAAVRTLYPVVTRPLTDTAADTAQETSWIEADPVGWDAPISVWWDHPPGGDPR